MISHLKPMIDLETGSRILVTYKVASSYEPGSMTLGTAQLESIRMYITQIAPLLHLTFCFLVLYDNILKTMVSSNFF